MKEWLLNPLMPAFTLFFCVLVMCAALMKTKSYCPTVEPTVLIKTIEIVPVKTVPAIATRVTYLMDMGVVQR
jgi:hypothetical protein